MLGSQVAVHFDDPSLHGSLRSLGMKLRKRRPLPLDQSFDKDSIEPEVGSQQPGSVLCAASSMTHKSK